MTASSPIRTAPARPRRGRAVLAASLLALTVLAGCSSQGEPQGQPLPTRTPTAPPQATAAAVPPTDACYRLDFDQAVSPTNASRDRSCERAHTSQTFAVGALDNLVDGHLLAVDSQVVQDDVATTCPAGLRRFVGGSVADVRLSMLRAVWFTPTVEESDAGAAWFRCDVVALAGTDRLDTVTGSLRRVLGTEEGRARYGMCGTANPDTPDFERVPCGSPHSWRAIQVVELPDGDYPGEQAVTAAGADPCELAGASVADDPLDYEWAYEGPDQDQWDAGQTFGRCWAPDASAG